MLRNDHSYALTATTTGSPSRGLRLAGAAVLAACAIALAGCGGGGEISVGATQFQPFEVAVVGTSYAPALPGQVLDVAGRIGQPLVFDASEPVRWSFAVNGSPLFAGGTTVDVGGITLTESQVSATRVVLDSQIYGPAMVPVDVLLTATSAFDDAQVATIRLELQ